MSHNKKITLLASAKVNLFFQITGKLPNGYHTVETVMQSISLADKVTLSLEPNGTTQIKITCNDSNVPTDSSNIVYQVAEKFFDRTATQGCLLIDIEKNIPSQAGLGGGSSDGAAVLVGLNQLFQLPLSTEELCYIGGSIGVDIPFCIVGGTQRGTHFGEILEPVTPLKHVYFVVAKPESSVSTPEAFQLVDRMKLPEKDVLSILNILEIGDTKKLGKYLYNSFEFALPSNDTNIIKNIMVKHNTLGAILTGSGSAVIGLFEDAEEAFACVEELKTTIPFAVVAESVPYGVRII